MLGIANVSAQMFETTPLTQQNNQPETTVGGKQIIRTPLINKTEKNKEQKKKVSRILMYYKNFKIDITPSGRVMCDFDLVIHNSTPNKINTLNAQFVWPSIKTNASFYDVPARSERYLSLTLMGNGCYSMDKAPNIVLNHCRIKGMSEKECASAIHWVKVK